MYIEPFHHLINLSFKKSGSSEGINNYRPISIIYLFSHDSLKNIIYYTNINLDLDFTHHALITLMDKVTKS